MDPLKLGATVDISQVEALLKKKGALTADLSPVFRTRLAASIAHHLNLQYQTRGAHLLGQPWQPLSITTIRLRTRVIGGRNARTVSRAGQARAGFATPMQNTRRSYLSLVRRNDAEGIRNYGTRQMEWGSRLPYLAQHHREGGFSTRVYGRGPLKHVPQRAVIPAQWPVPIVNGWASDMLKFIMLEA